MNERTESAASAKHEYRMFDEFDVSKALRIPFGADEVALIETVVANALTLDVELESDDTTIDMSYGYELANCGGRRMCVNGLSDDAKTTMTIDVTKIVETILDLLRGVMAGRLKNLQDSYDLLHHQGIYAGNDADTTE